MMMMTNEIIKAHAKINFTLEILGKRDDGFHELRSVVVPIAFSDLITISPADAFTSSTGYDDDLCIKASRVLVEECGNTLPFNGLHFEIKKEIPVGGGLGGGSADAAAAMIAMNNLSSKPLPLCDLAILGAKVGSDVPALIYAQSCGPVLMEGRGERVAPLFNEGNSFVHPKYHLVLVNPNVFSSTPKVFSKYTQNSNNRIKVDMTDFCEAYKSCDPFRIGHFLMNDLENPAMSLYPQISDAKKALQSLDVCATLMSGSGSTLFAIVESKDKALKCASQMTQLGYFACATSTI